VAAYPAHWAPVDIMFYSGKEFPKKYDGGAFIAFHGSWNRAPMPQAGYNVTFQPFSKGKPSGDFEIFASGFPGKSPLMNPPTRPRGRMVSRRRRMVRCTSATARRARFGTFTIVENRRRPGQSPAEIADHKINQRQREQAAVQPIQPAAVPGQQIPLSSRPRRA